MCLAIPAQVIQILPEQKAVVNIGGITKEISTALLEQISEGDYVILHVGYALTRLDEQEALKTLEIFEKMRQGKSLA